MRTFAKWIGWVGLFLLTGSFLWAKESISLKKVYWGTCKEKFYRGIRVLPAFVSCVIDGDTVRVIVPKRGNIHARKWYRVKVRLLSIDTPETYDPRERKGRKFNKDPRDRAQKKWGQVAKVFLRKKLDPVPFCHRSKGRSLSHPVWIQVELGHQKCDKYGRVLGYLLKKKGKVQENLNFTLLKKGLAVNYCFYPNTKYCKVFGLATKESMQKKRGMFADKNLELPYLWRIRIYPGKRAYKYIGNLKTKEVYRPGSFDKVPVFLRVFFPKLKMVQAPYHRVR